MKVFVTGGTGLLGYNILKAIEGRGFRVYATFHTHTPPTIDDVEWIKLDLEEFDKVITALKWIKPNVVIHAAAYTDVDGCEMHRDKAYRINYLATKALAKSVLGIGDFLIYISTDYVFDGIKGMYKEDDLPNPINFYGLTKLLGEVAVQSILGEEKSLVIRVSGLYGYSPTGKKNFGIQALEKLMEGEEVRAFYDQYLSPTYAYSLAEKIVRILNTDFTGIIHIAGERMSRYEYVSMLAEVLSVTKSLVKPISIEELKLVARRPRDSSLDVSNARRLGLTLPDQKECIKHFVESFRGKVRT